MFASFPFATSFLFCKKKNNREKSKMNEESKTSSDIQNHIFFRNFFNDFQVFLRKELQKINRSNKSTLIFSDFIFISQLN